MSKIISKIRIISSSMVKMNLTFNNNLNINQQSDYLTTNHKVLELKLVITKGISNIDLKSINPKTTL